MQVLIYIPSSSCSGCASRFLSSFNNERTYTSWWHGHHVWYESELQEYDVMQITLNYLEPLFLRISTYIDSTPWANNVDFKCIHIRILSHVLMFAQNSIQCSFY